MRKKNNLKSAKPIPSALSVANPNTFKPGNQATSPSAAPAPGPTITAPKPAERQIELASTPGEAKRTQTSRVKGPEVSKSAQQIEVKFVLEESRAQKVSLCGTFNGWSTEVTPMKKDGAKQWAATLCLAPGRYEYKFLVDDAWRTDPSARENVPNQFGSLNSVLEVR